MERELNYSPGGETLAEFQDSDERRRMILGPIGSGKSVVMCWEIFLRACDQEPNKQGVRKTRWAVVRNTYPELKETTIKTWRDWFSDDFGSFVMTTPPTHHIKMPLPDGTDLDCEVLFVALDQEKHVRKLLSLELTGIFFNECREIRKPLIDASDGRIGRYPSKRDGGPTWYGMIADSNMPDEDHWIHEAVDGDGLGWQIFMQPGGVLRDGVDDNGQPIWVPNPEAENIENLPEGYYLNQLEGKKQDYIAVYLGAEFGRFNTEGSYFANAIAQIEKNSQVKNVPYDPALPVHVFFDLGVGSNLVAWFVQAVGNENRIIDYMEGEDGKGLPSFAKAMKNDKPYIYGDIVLPHDGNTTDMGSERTRKQTLEDLGFSVIVLDRGTALDRINAIETILPTCWFNKELTYPGLVKLRRYSRKHDKVRNIYLNEPAKDGNDHAADAFGTFAEGISLVSNNKESIPLISTDWIV